MKTIIIVFLSAFLLSNATIAQKSYEEENTGEFGITAGGAHYFGDLNTRASFSRAKPAFGIFYRKQFGDYVGVRLSGHYAQLGYSDVYSKNQFQRQRISTTGSIGN